METTVNRPDARETPASEVAAAVRKSAEDALSARTADIPKKTVGDITHPDPATSRPSSAWTWTWAATR